MQPQREDIRPRPTYWICRACGRTATVDRSRLVDFDRLGRRCDCGEPLMLKITKKTYDARREAVLAAIRPVTVADVQAASAELDRVIRIGGGV